jgi:hypothetical protein
MKLRILKPAIVYSIAQWRVEFKKHRKQGQKP